MSERTSSLPLAQPEITSGWPSPSRSKPVMAQTSCFDLTRQRRAPGLSYTPTVPLTSAYANDVRRIGASSTICSVSVVSEMTSSLRKTRISKSSDPTSSSSWPSSSTSQKAIADTLSPVTVQNSSLPSAS